MMLSAEGQRVRVSAIAAKRSLSVPAIDLLPILVGLVLVSAGYLGMLTAENTYQPALTALVQAQAARYGDTAALSRLWAAGGGTGPKFLPHRRFRTRNEAR
jgi:hypothetical protein